MSVSQDPLFRDQYAGGVRPDKDVEAALSGREAPLSPTDAAPPMQPMPYTFGAAVKLG